MRKRLGLDDRTDPSIPRNEFLKWLVAALLAVTLVGVIAIAYWLPVNRYVVTCKQSQTNFCQLQRDTSSEKKSWNIDLGSHPLATVKVQPVHRGSARIFLYLNSNSANDFAAEFEGGSARTDADKAAATLNNYFSSAKSAPVRVVASPPEYLSWLIWGGISFLVALVLVIYREMFTRTQRPN